MPELTCTCGVDPKEAQRIVLTGGPGAGKTAVLSVLRKTLGSHVTILPEAASILFSGGFPRSPTLPGLKAAQRAIFRVQGELERMAQEEGRAPIILCDRGALDGLAHWPGSNRTFFEEMGVSREELFQRYTLVIHLRTPCLDPGYIPLHQCRLEHPEAAIAIDHRIEKAWAGHPHRVIVGGASHFPEKVRQAVELVRSALPAGCHSAPIPA